MAKYLPSNIPSITKDLAEVKEIFNEAKAAGWNVLIPETLIAGLADQYALAIAHTTISVNLADGEIYADDNAEKEINGKSNEKKKYRLHKTALMRISGPFMAGLKWQAKDSGIETIDKDYMAFKSAATLLAPDGQEVPYVAHDDIDFVYLNIKYQESYATKAKTLKKDKDWNKPNAGKRDATEKEKEEYIAYCVNRDLMAKREHKLAIIETGAMERVIRGALGLKNSYTLAQLRMPFITARVVLRPDYSNKETRSAAISTGNQASKNIFGGNADITDILGKEVESEKKPENNPNNSAILDFENSDDAGQRKSITNLARQKGYNLGEYMAKAKASSVEALSKEKRIELFTRLLSMPDKEAGK